MSAGGAPVRDASWDLIDWIVSVGCTSNENDLGGFKDLKVMVMAAAVCVSALSD